MGGMNRRAQHLLGLPFSMIFSIILIVFFIVIAFIAIGHFLDIGRSSGVGMFYRELQGAVDDAFASQSSKTNFDIDLPSKIKFVCFANLSMPITNLDENYEAIKDYDVYDANVFLVPPEYAQNMQWKLIKHLDIAKITQHKNPYCVSVKDGLKINKGFYDKLVWIK